MNFQIYLVVWTSPQTGISYYNYVMRNIRTGERYTATHCGEFGNHLVALRNAALRMIDHMHWIKRVPDFETHILNADFLFQFFAEHGISYTVNFARCKHDVFDN